MPMNISINSELGEKLNRVAALTKKDIPTVLEGLLSENLDEKLARLEAIQEGLDDLAAGRVVDHETVFRELSAYIEEIAGDKS